METGRTPQAQLTTARLLHAMVTEQIAEYEAMGTKRRTRTARGRDLTARIDALREGHATWTARITELEKQIADAEPQASTFTA